ncbi:amidohydrolase family protein [Pseudoalteromonas sp. MMG022]|uniref:amidohydrolase family protein n=1 Tax=Pseudoalteromonas sp. MMG022 TaxID=2909978 RepID=UPI001F32AA28|nr:amidohydrolase family protein [Pseudoalteromonas sp. MMG022]MCF6436189.1 amidohydrolase family protein [Pseudoalteromonas sp. MMG022]
MSKKLIIFIALIIWIVPQTVTAQQILLTNGTLLDPSNQSARKQHLLLDENQIIGRFDEMPENFTGTKIDISGKFVLPGFVDMHTHAFGNRAPNTVTETMGPSTTAQVVLQAGVTGLVDLFGNEQKLFEHRRLQQQGLIGGADIYASLSCLTAPGGHCSQFGKTRTIANEQEAIEHITALAKKQADVIKLVSTLGGKLPSLSPQLLKFAVSQAHAHGLKVIVHIHTLADIESAIAANADAITHLPDDGTISERLAQKLSEHGVVVIPTLACDTDEYEFLFSNTLDAKLAAKVTAPRIIAGYRQKASQMTNEQKRNAKQRTLKYYQSIKHLIAANVPLLSGTDAGNYGTLQGFTLHRELAKFVAAGYNPWQALASATSDSRLFLGKPTDLDAGAQPSVVILNNSPIEDINNTQTIFAVIHRGVYRKIKL